MDPAAIAALVASILLSLKTGMESYVEITKLLKQLAGEADIPGWDQLEQTQLEIAVQLDAMIQRLKAI